MNLTETFQPTPRPQPRSLVDKLKAEAQTNACFRDVMHRFAIRQRARRQVTLYTLRVTMEAEGFQYPSDQYEHVLSFLASCGVGRLETDRGHVKALVDIKNTLQSIGQAAVGKQDVVKKIPRGPKLKKVDSKEPVAKEPKIQVPVTSQPEPKPTAPVIVKKRTYGAKIILTVDDSLEMPFELPRLTSEELLEIVEEIKSRKAISQ